MQSVAVALQGRLHWRLFPVLVVKEENSPVTLIWHRVSGGVAAIEDLVVGPLQTHVVHVARVLDLHNVQSLEHISFLLRLSL
jgi:hypothetical protein